MNAVAKNARVQMLWCKCDVANAMAKMLWVAKIPCHKCRGTNARMLWPECRSLNELAQMLWWECIGINVVARMRWWECCGAKAVNIRCCAVSQIPGCECNRGNVIAQILLARMWWHKYHGMNGVKQMQWR